MKVLSFTTLFPNAAEPAHGVFVRNRLLALAAGGDIELRVVAPVRWFPFGHRRFGRWARFARAPRAERQHGLAVYHPRYPVLPKVGMHLAPASLAAAARPVLARLVARGFDFDLIDAHYFYPDGVAAAALARDFVKPLVITARGTDVNLIPQRHPLARRRILAAAGQADAVVSVCAALRDALVDLGVAAERVCVLRNGVDLALFRPPADRAALRRRLGLAGPTLLSVGHLIERKGHDRVIRALAELPEHRLVIIGRGPEEGALRRLAARCAVAERVRFAGTFAPAELRDWYGAADALVLASSREGWANVLLEAMACGTPVVATPVWGTPEVVADPAAGRLSADRSPQALAAAVRALAAAPPPRAATRAWAERFGWQDTADGLRRLFGAIVARRRAAAATAPGGAASR
ncbi:MAG: glycosyl transferase family 1 [Gammaproteobacteria bacterium]|nr:MAG: glycosyl transferase family 1 [Gammaproteobacteria bacterium]